jgi:hypothetical protein
LRMILILRGMMIVVSSCEHPAARVNSSFRLCVWNGEMKETLSLYLFLETVKTAINRTGTGIRG